AQAATYYVAKTGSDSNNNCMQAQSPSTPKLTINGVQGGASCLSAGDTLEIKGGTYAEYWDPAGLGRNLFPSGLAVSSRTTIRAAAGEVVTITPPYPVPLLARFDGQHIRVIGGPLHNFRFVGGSLIEAGAGSAGGVIGTNNNVPLPPGATDIVFD